MRKLVLSFLSIMLLVYSQAQKVTYEKDIAPIIQMKCVSCHRANEAAPFSLAKYDDVAKRANFIKQVVETKFMPPWRADNNYVHFANDRSLTQAEIDLIVQWVDDKAPKGKATETTTIAQPVIDGTSYFRAPDLVLKAKDSFTVKGDGKERFIIFKVPFDLKDSASIEAVEFYSNNKKLVHHVNYAIHPVPETEIDIDKTDGQINLTDDDRRKFDQYQPYRKKISYYGGWIPGASYESYPKDFGWILPKRGVMLITVHYAPSSKDVSSICGVNLFYKKEPIKRIVKVISFGSGGIGEKSITPDFFVPPNEKKTFTLELTNPAEDLSVMYVWPHMHYIGKEFTAYITSSKGDTTKLVHIPDWDFRWQEMYRFQHLLRVPKGSILHIIGTYDNTAQNPFNPFSPPQTIASYGDMVSTDEMMTLMMIFLPYKAGDENMELN